MTKPDNRSSRNGNLTAYPNRRIRKAAERITLGVGTAAAFATSALLAACSPNRSSSPAPKGTTPTTTTKSKHNQQPPTTTTSSETNQSGNEQATQEVIDTYSQKISDLGNEIISSPGVKTITIDETNTKEWGLPIDSKISYLSKPSHGYPGKYDIMEVDMFDGVSTPPGITIMVGAVDEQLNPTTFWNSYEYYVFGAGGSYSSYKRKNGNIQVGQPLPRDNPGYLELWNNSLRTKHEVHYEVSAQKNQPFYIGQMPQFGKYLQRDNNYVSVTEKFKEAEPVEVTKAFDEFLTKGRDFLDSSSK